MSGRRAIAVQPPAVDTVPALSLKEAAAKLGVTPKQLEEIARRHWFLEPTFSISEVAAHFGQSDWQIQMLVSLGLKFGQALDPKRGGLYPTFKPSHKSRRIPLSAIERHKRHMARAHDGVAA